MGGWLYETSKYSGAFASGLVLLWVKDWIEKKQRRRHARRALWRILQSELTCAQDAEHTLRTVRIVLEGDAVIESVFAPVDMTNVLELEAIALDEKNAPAYWNFQATTRLNVAAAERMNELMKDYAGGNKATVASILLIAGRKVDSYAAQARARLQVLRVTQDEEPDGEVRARVLQAAERDVAGTEAIDVEMTELIAGRMPGAHEVGP